MKLSKKAGLLFCIVLFVIFCIMLQLAGAVKNAIISERTAAAKMVTTGFCQRLTEMFGNMNYATKLSYAIDWDDVNHEDAGHLASFKKNANKLMGENEHITFVAYFKENILDYVEPMDQFGSFLGKDLAEFPYYATLAKVVMAPVIEGPATLFYKNDNVFLFIHPVYEGTTYIGEIIVAMDADYVVSNLGLKDLDDGGYDYELWRVDFLGQSKIVIATSNATVDFSDAVKQQFSLPNTWSISVYPKGGWITRAETGCIYLAFIVLGFIILGIGLLLYYLCDLKKKLQIVRFTNSESGFFTMEGFSFFVHKRLLKHPDANPCILSLQFGNFRKFTKDMEYNELASYFVQLQQSVNECFTKGSLITRTSDNCFLIAVFEERQKLDYLIEEFILHLHWKRKINGKKVFIVPRYGIVTCPEHGKDAISLVREAHKQLKAIKQDCNE